MILPMRLGVALAGLVVVFSSARAADNPPPKIVELKVEPSALALTGPRDGRRFVVRGRTADGGWLDLTRTRRSQG